LQQKLAHRLDQAFRQGSKHHLSPDLDEERVVEGVAQTRQRAACSRLAQVQPFTRARDALLCKERVQGHEEVQV
jgi:hypothetical protein